MKIFKDRQSAGKLLAKHLKQYKHQANILVLGIPRGGVVVAAEIAKSLNLLPLDIIITRKIGHPSQPEFALGAVDADGQVLWEEELLNDLGLRIDDLKTEVNEEVEEIKRREQVYKQGGEPLDLNGKTAILVDDGIATGATILTAINYLKRHKVNKIILTVPVAGKDSVEKVTRGLGQFGEVIVLETPENFQAVSLFYQQFEPVKDQEVIQLLS